MNTHVCPDPAFDPGAVTQYAYAKPPLVTVRCIVELVHSDGTVRTLVVPNLEKAEVSWDVHTPSKYYNKSLSTPEPSTATLKVTGQLRPMDDSGNLYTIEKKDPE